MKKKKGKKNIVKITMQDYIKAVKKADREIQIENTIGWSVITKTHKNKKKYDRIRDRKNFLEE